MHLRRLRGFLWRPLFQGPAEDRRLAQRLYNRGVAQSRDHYPAKVFRADLS
jgi:hypothetical protein